MQEIKQKGKHVCSETYRGKLLMKFSRRTFVFSGLVGATVCGLNRAWAQTKWPNKPINYIVPFSPGGTTDIVARVLAIHMGQILGTTIVVNNKAGAGGNIGSAEVARAAPDGYTIGGGSIASHAINASLYERMPYDTLKDFTPITLIGTMPNVLIVPTDSPFRSVSDLVKAAKAAPGSISYASAGNGTSQHLSAEMLRQFGGLDLIHVPYQGAGPALQAVLAREVNFSFENLAVATPHIRDGKLRALAITSAERSKDWPDLPTLNESGFTGYEVTSWQAMFGPLGLPAPIVQQLNSAAVTALRNPEVLANFTKMGIQVVASSPEKLRSFQREEVTKWAKVIKNGNIKTD